MAIDKHVPSAPKAVVTKLDLTRLDHQELIIKWLHDPMVVGAFLAPPCGTASAARSIELQGEDDLPQPLRSPIEPDGIEGLMGLDLLRVGLANILYAFVAEVADICCALNKLFMIENPRSSLFWYVTPMVDRACQDEDVVQDHQACMYGSDRPKWTRLLANFEQVTTINLVCDHSHKHAASTCWQP